MPKRVFIIFLLLLNISVFGSIKEDLNLSVKLEQLNVQITKSFSIRASSVNFVNIKLSKGILIEELYLEISDGTFIKLDVKKLKGKIHAKWGLKNMSIKTITFTGRTNSITENEIEFDFHK